ncbi:hypothetical protein G6011_06490 [Alternaria panax]|uniref:Uncharacterized protein n=1 Tax=Alternaria panax TaxID=48097 RepID=A0AAD4FGH0_9PLEO|nr:hypothetical protein G6011_06490 [Alternaria panax]
MLFPNKHELLVSDNTMDIPFVSNATAAYYAERCPATIVKFMDAQRKGEPIRATGEYQVTPADIYLNNIPTRISDPDANIPCRASETYFAVWANTQYGKVVIDMIYFQLPGLRYKSTFPDGEIQRFVRERLTKNTNLNNAFASRTIIGCTKDMLAIAFLALVERRLSIKGALRQVKNIFWPDHKLSANVAQEIYDTLNGANNVFESDFGVEHRLPGGTRKFFLPRGYENRILAHRYGLEMFAYFKMPGYEPKHGEYSPLMEKLPAELMSMIARNLLVFKDPIQVIRKPKLSGRRLEFYFKVCKPCQVSNAATFRLRPGWIISPPKLFFALSKTNRKSYYLVRETFFKHNKILLHHCYANSGHGLGTHEVRLWLEAIGYKARRYLGNLSIRLSLGNTYQNVLNRDAIHTMIKLIGQSHCLRSLITESLLWNRKVSRSMAKIRSWLQPPTRFRGLTVFQVGGNPKMRAYVKPFVTRPKELQPHEQQPAFMSDNRNGADLMPLTEKALRRYNQEELILLYVHDRRWSDQINAVSVVRVAEEVSRKKRVALTMSKAELVKALFESKATWKRIAATQRKDRVVLREMKRLLASNARYS